MKLTDFTQIYKGKFLNSIGRIVVSTVAIGLSLFPLYGFVDFPQTGDKETIGMNIEKQSFDASNNRIEKDAVNNELNIKEGAVQGKIEVLKEFNSPFVQTDKIEVTAYQNQSDKIKTFEDTETFYPTGMTKSHTIKTSEPIQSSGSKSGLLSSFNFPSWLNTLILLIIGGGLLNKNYDILGKVIKTIKWLINKGKSYWGSK